MPPPPPPPPCGRHPFRRDWALFGLSVRVSVTSLSSSSFSAFVDDFLAIG